MKFSCLKQNISTALQQASRVVSSRPTLPVLNNILIRTKDGRVEISSTNLEIGLKTFVGSKVETEGAVTVPAKLLTDFVQSIPDEKISFSLVDNLLEVSGNNYEASFNIIDAEEFPETPKIKGTDQLIINAQSLAKNIPLVTFSAASDESRPVITGVLMTLDNKTLTMASADGYRLAEKIITLEEDFAKSNTRLIVPAKTLNEVEKIIQAADKQEVLQIQYDDNQVCFKYKDTQITSRLLVGQFPDYKQIIPAKLTSSLVIDKAELQNAVKVASYFAKDSASVIHFHFETDQGRLTLEAASSQLGKNTTHIPGEAKGNKGKISYNAKYVMDVLNVLPGKKVSLKINDPLSPGLISPAENNEKEPYTYIIMPIRT